MERMDRPVEQSPDVIRRLLDSQYGISGDIKRLPGENENYRVLMDDGRNLILKLAGVGAPGDMLLLEQRILKHLADSELDLIFPTNVLTLKGDTFAKFTLEDGAEVQARLQTFLAGTPWVEAPPASNDLLRDLGAKLAHLDLTLASLNDRAATRSHRWDLMNALQHRAALILVEDSNLRKIVDQMFQLYAARVPDQISNLPRSLIHGDANNENLLVEGDSLIGLVDFGDSLMNPVICELAIALAYVMLGLEDPLVAASEVVRAYHKVRPLTQTELELLYPLLCARLCTTIVVAAERRSIDPDHPTWFVTEQAAKSLLEELSLMAPHEAARRLAAGTGIVIYPVQGLSVDVLREERQRLISPSLSLAYTSPLKIVRGEGQYLFDEQGWPYLDLVNNVCHVGHCHPTVVEAGQQQMAKLNTNTRYLYDGLTAYAERLCATLPDPLEVCFLVNSGSEANELALRLAEAYTGRKDFLVIDGAYHGNTGRLVDLSPYKFLGKGGKGGAESWVHVVPMPDGYRGIHRGYGQETGIAYGDEVGRVISACNAPLAGFMAESLLGCGGQIIPPVGYFERAFEHVRGVGGVCIIDEVQVGFGRVGTHFWAFERYGVVPDIVVMGKPIGNGHPMGAVVTTRAIADAFANGMEFFSTFGGNPVSCAIGMAVLDVIQEQGLQQNALELGQYFLEGLHGLKAQHDIIGDVRGAGLFIGVELIRDRDTLEPATTEAKRLVEHMKAEGILLSTDGPFHNVIKIKPPMVITREDIDMVLRLMGDALAGLHAA